MRKLNEKKIICQINAIDKKKKIKQSKKGPGQCVVKMWRIVC